MRSGPAHNMLTIWPRQDVNLTSWSLSAAPRPTDARGPPGVRAHPQHGHLLTVRAFERNAELCDPGTPPVSAVVDVSHHAHKPTRPQDNTAEFDSLVNAMPDY
ncbi:hypothetical protein EVAR_101742_1 [Eumeta japonica]|uniref:Endoplasmic reticulum metallopeptidase 1-like C-terminal domain-containing protein n=1 Tax=Eumeta variegata TaxID=151549 RepID=A0A4C1SQK4_EUMVA|nr:hypothetical protein EVAR_101742_1 [Eumeta japonica]